jgi:hypothetical protein
VELVFDSCDTFWWHAQTVWEGHAASEKHEARMTKEFLKHEARRKTLGAMFYFGHWDIRASFVIHEEAPVKIVSEMSAGFSQTSIRRHPQGGAP